MDFSALGSQILPLVVAAIGAALMRQVVGRLLKIMIFLGVAMIVVQLMFPEQHVIRTVWDASEALWHTISTSDLYQRIIHYLQELRY